MTTISQSNVHYSYKTQTSLPPFFEINSKQNTTSPKIDVPEASSTIPLQIFNGLLVDDALKYYVG